MVLTPYREAREDCEQGLASVVDSNELATV